MKRYFRLWWKNKPSVETPINAENLNKMDKGIDDIDNAVEDVQRQINQLVIEGDSSVEAAQARSAASGAVFETLKERLDDSDTRMEAMGSAGGDTKDSTVTFDDATEDIDIESGEKHSTLFSKIKKSIQTLRTALSGRFDKSNIVHTTAVSDTTKVPSSVVTADLQNQINVQNDNLAMNTVTYTLMGGVTINVYNTIRRIGKEVHIHIKLNVSSSVESYGQLINFTDLPTKFLSNQLIGSDKGVFFVTENGLHTGVTLSVGEYFVNGVVLLQ